MALRGVASSNHPRGNLPALSARQSCLRLLGIDAMQAPSLPHTHVEPRHPLRRVSALCADFVADRGIHEWVFTVDKHRDSYMYFGVARPSIARDQTFCRRGAECW